MQLRDYILDQYNIRARLYPALLLVGPTFSFLLLLVDDNDEELFWGMTLVAFPLTYLLISIVRNKGAKLEKDIFNGIENKPLQKALINEQYRKSIGIRDGEFNELPYKEHPVDARIGYFKMLTRDHKEFPVVFDTLCTYGFYRNLYGIGRYLIMLFTSHLIVSLAIIWKGQQYFEVKSSTLLLFCFLHFLMVAFIYANTTKKQIIYVAETYAKAMLRAGIKIKPISNR